MTVKIHAGSALLGAVTLALVLLVVSAFGQPAMGPEYRLETTNGPAAYLYEIHSGKAWYLVATDKSEVKEPVR